LEPTRILHVLSQRPSRTGSGITLDSLVALAEGPRWHQAAVVGVPWNDTGFTVGSLPTHRLFPVRFGHPEADLPFPVPGMSDVMPYPSSVWSRLQTDQLAAYRRIWRRHLQHVIGTFRPHLIHSNHIWLVSSLLKDLAPDLPVVTTSHATGLRQMDLTPHLRHEVIAGCRRNDHFLALRGDHARQLTETLGVEPARATVCGVGFREDFFHAGAPHPPRDPGHLLYVGKYSRAKGLPWLLDAFTTLHREHPDLVLHIAGDGAGAEAEGLRARMQAMAPQVVLHGMLDQPGLADLMRRCTLMVLPSFYEGVPLVLVEAAACGCRLVATDLPGVREEIAPHLGAALRSVPLPRLQNVDVPLAADLPALVHNLREALAASLAEPAGPTPDLGRFTWQAVFRRVERVWSDTLAGCRQ